VIHGETRWPLLDCIHIIETTQNVMDKEEGTLLAQEREA
jgi:hypothetical protein